MLTATAINTQAEIEVREKPYDMSLICTSPEAIAHAQALALAMAALPDDPHASLPAPTQTTLDNAIGSDIQTLDPWHRRQS